MKHPKQLNIRLSLTEEAEPDAIRQHAAAQLGCDVSELPELTVRKRSIDARGRAVKIQYSVHLGTVKEKTYPPLREVSQAEPPVAIIGAGPAGMFCAYQLARNGIASIVLDRGKKVQPRRKDLRSINQLGQVDEDSNYCFGEGGAGTYSDGKLYTRSHKRGDVDDVLKILTNAGADPSIRIDARPHIGSNKLPKVVTALRESLEAVGVNFQFGARVTGIRSKGGVATGIQLLDGTHIEASAVVVATGHSARDVYEMLDRQGVSLEAKPFALGVRIEHPQECINEIQYGRDAGHPLLPAAPYKLVHNEDGRGVFSFCMCPGGFIVPAATQSGEIVVNGMSPSRRNSRFANSGIVVSISPDDYERAGFTGPFAGLDVQKSVERAAAALSGEGFRAPATRLSDFMDGKISSSLPKTSYQPGLQSAALDDILRIPGLSLADHLRAGVQAFEKSMPGYLTNEAVVVATESRTSSPVRIPRNEGNLMSPSMSALYPCGEGAGYAGGIMSAAIDGFRVAEAIAIERLPFPT